MVGKRHGQQTNNKLADSPGNKTRLGLTSTLYICQKIKGNGLNNNNDKKEA